MSDYHYADDVAELKDAYPVGTAVEVEHTDGERYRARVTGYAEVVNDGRTEYANPGARLCVSTNPPDGERVENDGLDVSRAAMIPKGRIIGTVDESD